MRLTKFQLSYPVWETYFHNKNEKTKKKTTIKCLYSKSGKKLEDFNSTKHESIHFFQALLGTNAALQH